MYEGRGMKRRLGAMLDGLFPCNVIGHIGKLGEVGLVKGMIHGNDLVDAQALSLNVGKAAA